MISNIAAGFPVQMGKILENDDWMMRLKTALTIEPDNVKIKLKDFFTS